MNDGRSALTQALILTRPTDASVEPNLPIGELLSLRLQTTDLQLTNLQTYKLTLLLFTHSPNPNPKPHYLLEP